MTQYTAKWQSPLGEITLVSDGTALTGLWFTDRHDAADAETKELPIFRETVRWLECYFGGKEPDFTPKVALRGTAFQELIWEMLTEIPYGRTTTYGALAAAAAKRLGAARMSAQAVGGAVGRNPVSLIVPCHRVIGARGSLTGYAGGTERKRTLLELEKG
ncbi:MAG: methylated-DNA--[Oscillospiraceae bacterium]|nr:methylated-DNA--[protein]-cysteine S-methyltransferase [Oscillospiraceae bacterium]